MGYYKRRGRTKSSRNKQYKQQADQQKATINQFPFLFDEKTINHVKLSKVLFVMRGLSGSGKSTIVELIKSKYNRAVACSADDFFLDDRGNYNFDARSIGKAHEFCQQKANRACDAKKSVVVVDNTNVKKWEMMFYIKLAALYAYTVVIVTPQTAWRFDPMELARRNKHGVPQETLEAKVRQFQTVNPLYWAWFINERDTKYLHEMAGEYFTECINHFPKFRALIMDEMDTKGAAVTFEQLYHRRRGSATTVHCTAYYCEDGPKSATTNEYAARETVKKAMGHSFGLYVIGLVITPRTVGARVALNHRQMLLWNQNDVASATDNSPESLLAGELGRMSLSSTTHGHDSRLPQAASEASIDGQYESLQKRHRFRPTIGRGSRAHITLGFSAGHAPVETGYDLIQVVEVEQKAATNVQQETVNDVVLRYYDEGRCVVYFHHPIQIPALFSGKY